MSIETWKEEFYPILASEVAAEDAVAHSLRKWQGLLPENLQKHALIVDGSGSLRDFDERFSICNVTCALCAHYYDENATRTDDAGTVIDYCPDCPLSKVLGDRSCASGRYDVSPVSSTPPFDVWCSAHNPRPMITALEQAAAYEKEHKGDACPQNP